MDVVFYLAEAVQAEPILPWLPLLGALAGVLIGFVVLYARSENPITIDL